MKQYIETAKTYIADHKKEFITGASIVAGIAVILFGLALYSYNNSQPAVIYEPAKACNLLTLDEAKELLGDATINGVTTDPVQTGGITTSKCAYSDGLTDVSNAVVIALSVRSAINDDGIRLNKAQFESGIPTDDSVEVVKNVGDEAYFNKTLGQLNVLKETTWVLISYGPGADPSQNTLEDALKVADKVLK